MAGKRKKKLIFGKLQITPLKFGNVWILHLEVLKFGFYPFTFGVFRFYILTFQNLDFTPYILEVFGFYFLKFESI